MRLLEQIAGSEWSRGWKSRTCGSESCARWLTERQLAKRQVGVSIGGIWYCSYRCVVSEIERQLRAMGAQIPARLRCQARFSLGLTFLQRGLITESQYRNLMQLHERTQTEIGELVIELGLVSEEVVTEVRAALWSCPVLSWNRVVDTLPLQIPRTLCQRYSMLPLRSHANGRMQFVGFKYEVAYVPVLAVEQMTSAKLQPCIISPSDFSFYEKEQTHEEAYAEHVFERVPNIAEAARTICECGRSMDATRVSVVRCGDYLWSRLSNWARTTDLMFFWSTSEWSADEMLAR